MWCIVNYYAVQGASNIISLVETLMCDIFDTFYEQYFHVVLFIVVCKLVLSLSIKL